MKRYVASGKEPRRQPSTRLQALIWENQNNSAAGPPSKPEDFHRVNTFYTSLGKVLAEIENRFSGITKMLFAR